MVQVDVPMAFAVGAFLADSAGKRLRPAEPTARVRVHLYNLIYQVFFFSWVPVYFLLNNFGWETTHMWWHADTVIAYPLYVPVFVVVFFASGIAGCALGIRLVEAGRTAAVRMVYMVPTAFSAIWIFGQYQRTFRLGSYSEWRAGQAPWFYQDGVFLSMLIFTLAWWGAGLMLFRYLLRRAGSPGQPSPP